MNPRLATIAVTTLAFTMRWFPKGRGVAKTGVSPAFAVIAGFCLGRHHDGRPCLGLPAAMYLLRRGIAKQVFAGTMNITFAGNLIKFLPGRWLRRSRKGSPG